MQKVEEGKRVIYRKKVDLFHILKMWGEYQRRVKKEKSRTNKIYINEKEDDINGLE